MSHQLVPPNAEDVTTIVEKRLQAAREDGALSDSVTVEWRSKQLAIPVITMPVDLLSYNPLTHRIRAQRSLDADRDFELEADPFGPQAQGYLHDLLRGDPADPSKTDPTFEALKEDLKTHGQNEPGIITRAGVLINGNTRRAALRDLGAPHIRVGVLPSDAGHEDILSIELSLQLRRDYKRDYSFMNFLLAIEERIQAGHPTPQVLTDFRIKQATLDRSTWLIGFIREAIRRSTVERDGQQVASLRLVDFESHQGKLEELYRAYTALKSKAPDDAESLLQQRLMAIALDKSKTDLRLIDADFSERYLKDLNLSTPSNTTAQKGQRSTIPGTRIPAAQPSSRVEHLGSITTRILQARALIQNPRDVDPETVETASRDLSSAKESLESGLDLAGRDVRLKKRRLAPSDRIADAIDHINLTTDAIAEARSSGDFDPSDIDEGLNLLRDSLVRLVRQVVRSENGLHGGTGIQWLHQSVQIEIDGD